VHGFSGDDAAELFHIGRATYQNSRRVRLALGTDTIEETTFDGFKINPKIDPKKFDTRK